MMRLAIIISWLGFAGIGICQEKVNEYFILYPQSIFDTDTCCWTRT